MVLRCSSKTHKLSTISGTQTQRRFIHAPAGWSTWCGLDSHPPQGLGKTMQCAAFLAGSLGSGAGRRALIVAPKTLLAHWWVSHAAVGAAAATRVRRLLRPFRGGAGAP
jgi:hypothetical protein